MTKKPHVGGEIDSMCTKCDLLLNHRIVAMVQDKVVKVECLTCRGVHQYRPGAQAKAAAKVATVAKPRGEKAPRQTAAQRETQAVRHERELKHSWEKSIAGQP